MFGTIDLVIWDAFYYPIIMVGTLPAPDWAEYFWCMAWAATDLPLREDITFGACPKNDLGALTALCIFMVVGVAILPAIEPPILAY